MMYAPDDYREAWFAYVMDDEEDDDLDQSLDDQNASADFDKWGSFLEGKVAAMCGLKVNDNPYPYPSKLWVDWNNGYCRESPRRDETEEDATSRQQHHQGSLRHLKEKKHWDFVKPPTQAERKEWAQDAFVVSTAIRRKWAQERQQQR